MHHGGVLTRCIGDLRFKRDFSRPQDKQAVIPVPGVNALEGWKAGEWLIIGSFGFWDNMRFQSKNTIDKI